jgi:hypothetical protein
MNAQSELVKHKSASEPAHKIFHGANGVELPYWEEDGKIIRIAVSDTIAVDVTNPKGGNIRANIPGFGIIEKKNKISFLSQAAAVRRALEINSSMGETAAKLESQLKEQRETLLAASEIRPASLVPAIGGRKRDATEEFAHREFGAVITSFEGIEEYLWGNTELASVAIGA